MIPLSLTHHPSPPLSLSLSPSLSLSHSPPFSPSFSLPLSLPFFLLGGKIIMRSEIGNPGGTKSAVRTCLSVHTILRTLLIWLNLGLFDTYHHCSITPCTALHPPTLFFSPLNARFIATFLYSCSLQVGGSLLSSAPLSNTLNVSTASSGKRAALYYPLSTLRQPYLHPLFSIRVLLDPLQWVWHQAKPWKYLYSPSSFNRYITDACTNTSIIR